MTGKQSSLSPKYLPDIHRMIDKSWYNINKNKVGWDNDASSPWLLNLLVSIAKSPLNRNL